MIDALSFTITVAALGTALLVGARLATGRFVRASVAPALGLLQAALVVQAVLDVIGLLRGHRPSGTVTHLAYLAASLVVVPAVALQTRGDDGGWAAGLLVVALLVVAVLVVRLQTTWRTA